ncbi:hypothetical protein K0M31_000184, partial [Melipona bicolor]
YPGDLIIRSQVVTFQNWFRSFSDPSDKPSLTIAKHCLRDRPKCPRNKLHGEFLTQRVTFPLSTNSSRGKIRATDQVKQKEEKEEDDRSEDETMAIVLKIPAE